MIRFYFLFINIFVFTLITTFPASAIDVDDLYQASVPVSSQSSKDRLTGIKKAMQNVLIKVGGQYSVIEHSLFKSAIRKPNQYFLQFRYQTILDSLHLVVDFDHVKINQLFSQANIPLWGSLRPQILLWLVNENKLSREIIPSSSSSDVATHIKQTSKGRGLPVIFPLMDLDDLTNVSTTDIWGRFANPVRFASERYSPEKIVIIRISDHSLVDSIDTPDNCLVCKKKQYVVDWSIIEDHQHISLPYKGTEPLQLLTDVINDITEHVYQQYALVGSANNEMFIDVDNISGLTNYSKLYRFLENMASIQSITLIEVKGTHRRFKLSVLGSKSTLIDSLKLSDKLVQQIDPLAFKHADDIPIFYWQD